MPLANRCGGGGGVPQLCGQIDNFKVIPGALSATLFWTAPEPDEDDSFVGVKIVRKVGSAPTSMTDGTKVYEGTALTYTDTGLTAGTTYYYRAFAYNAKGKYQTAYRVVSLIGLTDVVLNNLSWDSIRAISDQGIASSVFSIGDTKDIVLNGTVGSDVKFSNLTVQAFIIGINHNATYEGDNRIHFQLGKINNSLICFVDSKYECGMSSSATLSPYTFDMTHGNMSDGGWSSSSMRQRLGNYAESPLTPDANTFLAVLPLELRKAMKRTNKYTDNVGSKDSYDTSTPEYVSPSSDLITVASEREYTNQTSGLNANQAERTYQATYAYYKAGNSRVHYKYNAGSTAAVVWTRSVCYYGDAWVVVYSDGSVSDMNIYGTYYEGGSEGVSPIFFV